MSSTVPSKSKPQPVLIVFSILAGLQVLTAGSALSDVIGTQAAGLIVLVIAAVQVMMTFYVRGVVTPNADVAAYIDRSGATVSGPAAGSIPTVVPVEVTRLD